MDDSTAVKMELPDNFMKKLNKVLKAYFNVRRDRAEIALKLKKKQAKLNDKFVLLDEPLKNREDELAAALRGMLIPNKLLLLTGTLRSFKTVYGEVSFIKNGVSTSISDPKGLEKQARKDRNLGKLGKFKRTWSPTHSLVMKFMKTMPEPVTAKYKPFLTDNGGFDEVYVKPNEPYISQFDPNKLSVSKVNLGPAPDPISQEDKSPDA